MTGWFVGVRETEGHEVLLQSLRCAMASTAEEAIEGTLPTFQAVAKRQDLATRCLAT